MNKIALSASSFPNTPPLEYVRAAERAGYDGIGLRLYLSPGRQNPFFPVVGNAPLMSEVRSAIDGAGLEVFEIFSYYIQPEMDFEGMLPSLEFGASLGAKYALVLGNDQDWSRMLDNFGQFCDTLAGFGLAAAIEAPLFALSPLELTLKLIREAGRPNAIVSLDPLAFLRAGDSVGFLADQDSRLFPYVQMVDGTPDGERRGPGEGAARLDAILDALTPGLPLSLKRPAPADGSHTSESWARQALADLRRFLEGYYARDGHGPAVRP